MEEQIIQLNAIICKCGNNKFYVESKNDDSCNCPKKRSIGALMWWECTECHTKSVFKIRHTGE